MSQMMERVVTEGTGRLAAVPGIRVAGKTGTATGEEGRPHAWFIGFGPVEQPSIAVAVFVESGGDVGESASGGSVAAPIAAQVISEWLNQMTPWSLSRVGGWCNQPSPRIRVGSP